MRGENIKRKICKNDVKGELFKVEWIGKSLEYLWKHLIDPCFPNLFPIASPETLSD